MTGSGETWFLGRAFTTPCTWAAAPPRMLRVLPDGRVFSDRAFAKTRARERGWRYAACPEGGAFRTATRVEDGKLVLELADTGTGIPAEMEGRLFELFPRAARTTAPAWVSRS